MTKEEALAKAAEITSKFYDDDIGGDVAVSLYLGIVEEVEEQRIGDNKQ